MTARLSESDIAAFEPAAKVGLLATVSPEGQPHISLITTIQGKSPTELMWGQFTEGKSKEHVLQDPKVAFLVMTPERELWRGTARWTHATTDGEDYARFNQIPMFRYNAYLGIHTVHYMDLVSLTGKTKLSMPGVVAGSLLTTLSRRLAGAPSSEGALKHWAATHIGKLSTLKFIAAMGDDGFPSIIPVVPTDVVNPSRLIVSPTVYSDELAAIPRGAVVALFAMSMATESVLVRGTFSGIHRIAGIRAGTIDIDWVYNSMPPKPGQIYPELPLEPVRDFS